MNTRNQLNGSLVMKPIRTLILVAAVLVVVVAPTQVMAQTVTLSLASPENGATIVVGQTIHWSIEFTVSQGDNEGLALLTADLTQASTNPVTIDIPPATAVPPEMNNFARPAGITNPGGVNPVDGYMGVQRGPGGAQNLMQIGGAQNTFGVARPSGAGIAENTTVSGGIGQSGSVLLTSGSFTAPAACGAYSFSLANAMANVLTSVQSPPAQSLVAEATVAIGTGSFTVNIIPVADLNADCAVDPVDAELMVGVLIGTVSDPLTVSGADLNHDGQLNGLDVQSFVNAALAP
ncbi:MAG: hypothetical protein HS101_07895 [Planctomycetia bacterium]|nr:hypothetical protein [Planctomycetia bacterium]